MFNSNYATLLQNAETLDDAILLIRNLDHLQYLTDVKFYHTISQSFPFAELHDLEGRASVDERSHHLVSLPFCSSCKTLLTGRKVCQICYHGNDAAWYDDEVSDAQLAQELELAAMDQSRTFTLHTILLFVLCLMLKIEH